MYKFIFGFIIVIASNSFGNVSEILKVESIHGDNKSKLMINRISKTEVELQLYSSGRFKGRRKLSQQDLDFILKEYQKLPVPLKVPQDCYRSRLDITLFKNGDQLSKKSSCFGMTTETSADYVRFARILTVSP